MNRFKELKVWQEAIELASDIYQLTDSLPDNEKFGITSQIKRAVVSISSNIAEGAGRNNKGEFIHFLGIAQGSTCEVESLLFLSIKLKLFKDKELTDVLSRISKIQNMIFKLKSSIK